MELECQKPALTAVGLVHCDCDVERWMNLNDSKMETRNCWQKRIFAFAIFSISPLAGGEGKGWALLRGNLSFWVRIGVVTGMSF